MNFIVQFALMTVLEKLLEDGAPRTEAGVLQEMSPLACDNQEGTMKSVHAFSASNARMFFEQWI